MITHAVKMEQLFKTLDEFVLEEEIETFIKNYPGSDDLRAFLRDTAKIYGLMLTLPLVREKVARPDFVAQFNEYLALFAQFYDKFRAARPEEFATFNALCSCMFEAQRFAWIKFLQRAKLRFLVLFTLNDTLLGKFLHVASYAEIKGMGESPALKQVVALNIEPPKPKPEKEKYRAKPKKPKALKKEKAKHGRKNKGAEQSPILARNIAKEGPIISHHVANWYEGK